MNTSPTNDTEAEECIKTLLDRHALRHEEYLVIGLYRTRRLTQSLEEAYRRTADEIERH